MADFISGRYALEVRNEGAFEARARAIAKDLPWDAFGGKRYFQIPYLWSDRVAMLAVSARFR